MSHELLSGSFESACRNPHVCSPKTRTPIDSHTTKPTEAPVEDDEAEAPLRDQTLLPVAELPGPSSRHNGTEPGLQLPHVGKIPFNLHELPTRRRVKSAPQKVWSMRDGPDGEDLPLLAPARRSRAKSYVAPSSSKSPSSSLSADHSRASPRRLTLCFPARRPLNSTMRQVLPENFRFRVLVVGKSGSGKSSLIKAIFKVDMTVASERAPGKAGINLEFRPDDNRYLIVHEFSGLDSQDGEPQDLQTIRDFISPRTDLNRSPSERLHLVWICVPASDAIAGRLGNGVEELLGLRSVPVVLVFTKYDVVVSQARLDSPSGELQNHERAKARAHTMYEESCHRLFQKGPREVPAEIVSENPRFIDLIDNLIVTTDTFITDLSTPSTQSSIEREKRAAQRLGAVPLAWSAALRVNHDITIQASVEVGRSRYWCNLWFSPDFANQTLKDCVNIIHVDIVDIWNLNDKTKYLSSETFKVKMSHLVKDLARSGKVTSRSPNPAQVRTDYAAWVYDMYRDSQENVRCLVGYIVDLTVIMDGIFRMAAGDMSPKDAKLVFERHVRSGHRAEIHRDIRSFVTEAFAIRPLVTQRKDLILERIIDLIKQFCVPPPRSD